MGNSDVETVVFDYTCWFYADPDNGVRYNHALEQYLSSRFPATWTVTSAFKEDEFLAARAQKPEARKLAFVPLRLEFRLNKCLASSRLGHTATDYLEQLIELLQSALPNHFDLGWTTGCGGQQQQQQQHLGKLPRGSRIVCTSLCDRGSAGASEPYPRASVWAPYWRLFPRSDRPAERIAKEMRTLAHYRHAKGSVPWRLHGAVDVLSHVEDALYLQKQLHEEFCGKANSLTGQEFISQKEAHDVIKSIESLEKLLSNLVETVKSRIGDVADYRSKTRIIAPLVDIFRGRQEGMAVHDPSIERLKKDVTLAFRSLQHTTGPLARYVRLTQPEARRRLADACKRAPAGSERDVMLRKAGIDLDSLLVPANRQICLRWLWNEFQARHAALIAEVEALVKAVGRLYLLEAGADDVAEEKDRVDGVVNGKTPVARTEKSSSKLPVLFCW